MVVLSSRMLSTEPTGSFRLLTMGSAGPAALLRNQKTGLGTGIVKALAQQLGAKVETLTDHAGATVAITHATFRTKERRAV